jgi:predicted permease
MSGFLQDLRVACRGLLQKPSFALLTIVTLALGCGATTVIFTVINGVLLKPLVYPQSERLLTLHVQTDSHGERWGFSYPDFLDDQRACRSCDGVAAWTYSGGTVSAPGPVEYVDGRQISPELFSVLRVALVQGRSFVVGENQVGSAPVAIISARLWQRRYGADPRVVGMPLTYDGKVYSVVGIAPPGFQLDGDVDVLTPLGQASEPRMRTRLAHFLHVVARLRDGVTLSQAQTELAVVSHQLAQQYPDSNAGITQVPRPLKSELVQDVKPTLWLLLGAVGVVLLIGCVNVASLLLTRVVSRRHEFALRLALGAPKKRVVRQCLTESGLLGICGGLAGLLLATVGTHPFVRFWPDRMPRADEIQVDWRVLIFTISVSIATGLAFGLIPAWSANKTDIEETLRSRSRSVAGSARRSLSGFVMFQIALALVLLSAAGMLGRTLLRLSSLDPGVDIRNVLTARVAFSPSALANPAKVRAAWQELMDNMRHAPGVQSVALTDIVPMRVGENVLGYWATPTPPPPNEEREALASGVMPDYLKVMRLPLLRGRFIDENDRLESSRVVVIDENLARHAFGGADPVGKLLTIPSMGEKPVQVVGVVRHVRHWGLADDDLSTVQDQCYYPLAQVPDRLVRFFSSVMSVVVRTNVPPANTVTALQHQVQSIAGDQTLYEVRTMEQLASASLSRQRFLLLLFGIFAGTALLLACSGIYGVIAYLMSQRVPEIGVRLALGATSSDIVRLVLRESVVMIAVGLGVGLVSSVGTGRVLQRLVPGVQGQQGSIFVLVLPVLVAVALLASYIPTRRAAKVDPIVALRYE